MKDERTGINKLKEKKITRRSFLSSIVSIWGILLTLPFIYSIIEYLRPPGKKFISYRNKQNDVTKNTSILLSELPENSSKFIKIDDEEVLIIRQSGMNIIAFSALCSHLDCIVGYRKNENDIICNCHGSSFNLDGMPHQGPAREPLTKYKVTIESEKVIINSIKS